jgi:murein L,D-transpeptidase YcbB/YkuD
MRNVCLSLFLIALAGGAWIPQAMAAEARARSAKPNAVEMEIRAQAGGRLKKFYAGRSFKPLWASSGAIGPEANLLLGYLKTARLDGLEPTDYKIDDLRALIAAARPGDPRAVARAELRLSDVFSHYVADMRRPAKDKKAYRKGELIPKKLSAETALRLATLPQSFPAYMASMGWMSPHYVQFRTLLRAAEERGSSDETLRRLRLNRNRAQALPGPWTHHVVVDAASGRLWYYQAGKQAGTMRVVVGKPETQTPMLSGMLHYAILNPYWNVPTDLAKKLIAPKVLAGRSLASMGFEVLSDWSPSAHKVDPATINWAAVASGAQEIRLRQLPGGSNSMGRVKFMFPNDQGIYLHDTPERDFFTKADRHLSNGCIRLEDAESLGKWLLGRPIRVASKKPEQVVALPVPVPVYLTYFSAIKTKQGVDFVQDVYRRDQGDLLAKVN